MPSTYKYDNPERLHSSKITELHLSVINKSTVSKAAVCLLGEVTFVRSIVHISALKPNKRNLKPAYLVKHCPAYLFAQ